MNIPPLRDRKDDISLLTKHFILKSSDYIGQKSPELSLKLIDMLKKYSFPGNVRELKSLVYDAVIRNDSTVLSMDVFKNYLFDKKVSEMSTDSSEERISSDIINNITNPDTFPTLKQLSEELIYEALRISDGNQSEAARILGITPSALNKRIKRNQIEI